MLFRELIRDVLCFIGNQVDFTAIIQLKYIYIITSRGLNLYQNPTMSFSDNTQFSIAVIIPNYGRPDLLSKLLDSIKCAIWPDALIGIWVVENGNKGDAENIVDLYQLHFPVHYRYIATPSSSLARNTGAIASNADICIFFDDDVRIEKGTLLAYEKMITKYGLRNFYGGPLFPDYEVTPEAWLLEYLPASAKGFYFDKNQEFTSDLYFLGGNHAVPLEALEQLGMYDTKGASGESNSGYIGEETRVQKRLVELGFKGVPDYP